MNRKECEARMILPKGMKYITVLDFEVGRVFQYKIDLTEEQGTACDYERFISDKGHNLTNCEWMIHDSSEVITN